MSTEDTLVEETELKMDASIEALIKDFASYRTGKASPSIVEGIIVEYYGTRTRLKDIAGITSPEPRLLVVQPWDQSAIQDIEKAIIGSSLGISPVSDGRVLRLPIPELSEERRKDLSKQVKKRAEDAKVQVRNHRRDANQGIKDLEKDGAITEDDVKLMQKDVQDITDASVTKIDKLTDAKEQEILEV
ncbi:MAG: ribosome recycling factor [Lentisphaeria bacterium]|nr:ribosome recycling factor [Lentisphaeria bacterium]